MWSLFGTLFADTRDPLQSPEVIWGVVGLAGALFVGAGVIYAVDKWRKRAAADTRDADDADALTSYREMYENGEITDTEYAELRRRVADKVKKTGAKPEAAPAAGPTPSLPPLAPPPPPPAPAEPPPPPSTA